MVIGLPTTGGHGGTARVSARFALPSEAGSRCDALGGGWRYSDLARLLMVSVGGDRLPGCGRGLCNSGVQQCGEVGWGRHGLAQADGGAAGIAFRVAGGQRGGGGGDDSDDLAEGFTSIVLMEGESEHGDVVTGVQPWVRLRQDVGPLEVGPSLRGIGCGSGRVHFFVVAGACGVRNPMHDKHFRVRRDWWLQVSHRSRSHRMGVWW